jgi:putative ABC transport system permease protein
MTAFIQDVRHAFRTLRRSPGLVIAALLSLALGIGANTAVFSFVNAVQFKALPFADENTLVDIEETSATDLCLGCAVGTSAATLLDWQSRATSFSAIGAFEELRMVVSGAGEPERIPAAHVTPSLFPMLGIQPVLGRGILSADEQPGAEPVVLLSDALWRRRFRSDRQILGRAVKIDGLPRTVVGVMPAGFRFPEFAQLWIPLPSARINASRSDRTLGVIGRLHPGTDAFRADAEMKTIGAAISAANPETNARWTTRVRLLREAMTAETVAPSIVLLSAITFVLLIACANVSNLLLARAAGRQRELAIRIAIGSSRLRVCQLLFAESAVLSLAGGLLGLLLALWASRMIVASLGVEAPYWIHFGIDWHVFVFCAVVTLGAAVVFGTAPALHGARQDPQSALKDGGTTSAGRRGRRLAGGFVVAQLALSFVLLAGAGLLIKAVSRTVRFDPGYDATRVLEGDLSLSDRRYNDPRAITTFVAGVLERLGRLPHVRAGVSRTVFFRGFGARARQVAAEGRPILPEGASPSFYFAVTPGYFRMLGMRIEQGREFTSEDHEVAIVNAAMAQRIWPGISALGQRIRFGDGRWLTVIGVVVNSSGTTMSDRVASSAYVPFETEPGRDFALMLSAPRDAAALAPEVREAVKFVDPDQPLEDVMTMADAFREQAAPARFVGVLMSSLSGLGLLLASIGLYGVTAFGLRSRIREIGIRLALGGSSGAIVRMILMSAWKLIAPGLVLGLFGAWAGTRLLEGILFGTSPTDPTVFVTVVAVLAGSACLASYLPARRAAAIDPLIVLRTE